MMRVVSAVSIASSQINLASATSSTRDRHRSLCYLIFARFTSIPAYLANWGDHSLMLITSEALQILFGYYINVSQLTCLHSVCSMFAINIQVSNCGGLRHCNESRTNERLETGFLAMFRYVMPTFARRRNFTSTKVFSDWLTDWLTERLTDWPTNQPTNQPNQPTDQLST
jgi:hypothetical protein